MSQGYSNYAQSQMVAETMQESEARALLRCAAKLEMAQQDGVRYADYCEAVRHNQRLWTVFQMSLLKPEHGLPGELADLLRSLSLFVDRRSMRAFGEHEAKLLTVLININRQVAAGLMQQMETMATTTVTAEQMPAPSMPQDGINIAG